MQGVRKGNSGLGEHEKVNEARGLQKVFVVGVWDRDKLRPYKNC